MRNYLKFWIAVIGVEQFVDPDWVPAATLFPIAWIEEDLDAAILEIVANFLPQPIPDDLRYGEWYRDQRFLKLDKDVIVDDLLPPIIGQIEQKYQGGNPDVWYITRESPKKSWSNGI